LFWTTLIGLVAAAAPVDAASPLGTWHLNANGHRLTVVISRGTKETTFTGTLAAEGGAAQALDHVAWDQAARRLEFRRSSKDLCQWYRGTLVEGVFVGRFSHSDRAAARPAQVQDYRWHATGWNTTQLDRDIVPRVWEVLVDQRQRARLRIDRAPDSKGFTGRLKVYTTVNQGSRGEQPEHDLEVRKWDGTNLEFVRRDPNRHETYTGKTNGRTISGTLTQAGVGGARKWSGSRAEVLGYGLAGKTTAQRQAWQQRTRQQLFHLMMAGNPAPLTRKVTVVRADLAPIRSKKLPAQRDDDPERWPQNYRRSELQLDFTLPNPYGGPPLTRRVHAYLAVPTGKLEPGARRPAVLAVNGHGGSAWQSFHPDSEYFWYGDAFARRGYVVLAVDISHRPHSRGDDPAHGNGPHPAIQAAGLDSDWEEDGERAGDAMRGLDHLLARTDVDPKRVLVTGLSMGGEVSMVVAALDTRLAMSLPAGYSPDLGIMLHHGNCPCWRWRHADLREYVDPSDFFALTAPRPLLVQTGKRDFTFSALRAPFAADKQVIRRARVAYGSGPLVHYLHDDTHHWHAGDVNPTRAGERGVRSPVLGDPDKPWSLDWQTDARTKVLAPTLFDWVAKHLK
jgi:acetyl esterase/lipase